MVRTILIVVGVVVALVLLLIVSRPGTMSVERSTTVSAPPATVYALVEDFHAWERWSPWDKLDPSMRRTYSGAPRGEGAVYAWSSTQGDVGSGQMTITDVKPDQQVGIKLEFTEPFADVNRTEFLLAPEGDGTRVTWRMTGENSFSEKAMGLVMNMDQLIGRDFEQGLATLKGLAEEAAAEARARAETPPPAEAAAQAPDGAAPAGAPPAAADAGTPAPAP